MGVKRKLYETIARHLKGGAWGKGREGQDMASRSRTYTFGEQRVYVWCLKRIRLGQVPNLPPPATELSCFILEE